MNDGQIRDALRRKVFRHLANDPATRIFEEFSVKHGAARADFAVVNGRLHGFELKSDRDSLGRLERQVHAFSSVFDRMTLVVGYRHAGAAIKIVPAWWGVKLATLGRNEKVELNEARRAIDNPAVDKLAVMTLLWREEALAALIHLNEAKGMASKTRRAIYDKLADCSPLDFIRETVRIALRQRTSPKSDAPHALSGG